MYPAKPIVAPHIVFDRINIKGTVNLGAIFLPFFIQYSVHQLIKSLGWKLDFGCDLLKMFIIVDIINGRGMYNEMKNRL